MRGEGELSNSDKGGRDNGTAPGSNTAYKDCNMEQEINGKENALEGEQFFDAVNLDSDIGEQNGMTV